MTAAIHISLLVNGEQRAVTCDPETPLLYVLRWQLGLFGTRFGCGQGECGACTVIVGDRAVKSCQITVGSVRSPVRTVEGLRGDHPVQRAFIEEQAGQCGYCLSGMVMSAVALLEASPHPDRSRIVAALGENLCRCGSHLRILRAIERAAARP